MKKIISLMVAFVLFTGCSSTSSTKTATCTQDLEGASAIKVVLTQGEKDKLVKTDMTFSMPYSDAILSLYGSIDKMMESVLDQLEISEGPGVKIDTKNDEKKKEVSVTISIDLSKADKKVIEKFSFEGTASAVLADAKAGGATCTDFK